MTRTATLRILRRVTAHDALQASILVWWGIALAQVTAQQRSLTPLFRHMTAIMPWPAWIVLPCAIAIGLAAAVLIGSRRGLVIMLIVVAAWWCVFTYLIFSVSSTYLTPGLTLAFAVAAIIRQAELRLRP